MSTDLLTETYPEPRRKRLTEDEAIGRLRSGMTIGIGLLLDTLIVRSLMTPSIAAILGPWFWWPLKVRQRPAYSERMQVLGTPGGRAQDDLASSGAGAADAGYDI